MLELREFSGATEIPICVTTRASKHAVTGWGKNRLLISTRAIPAEGAANEAIIEILSEVLIVAKSRIHVVRGVKNREKWVRVDGLSLEDVRVKLGL